MPKTGSFDAQYPSISDWVTGGGWVEIGPDGGLTSFVRALDDGGMIWEGEAKYPTLDAALQALEAGIESYLDENG